MIASPRTRQRRRRHPIGAPSSTRPPLTIARGHPQAEATRPRAEAARPLALTLLDAAGVSAFAALTAAIAWRFARLPWDPFCVATLGAAATFGYGLADVVSGVVHWIGDTFFDEKTPVIGAAFVRPFREHHRDPRAITRHGFLEVNGNNCLALLPLLVPTWLLGGGSGPDVHVPAAWFQAMAVSFAVATFGTNQFHKWAHLESAPRWVGWLQASRLILSPSHHARHHAPPHRRSYCVTVGWTNPLLDAIAFFERAERAVRTVGALALRRRTARPEAEVRPRAVRSRVA
ncbi:MAG TPA: fatty acid desaturase CarF family protein [Candidatus Binatia bacterium]|nr:fatty acid desaturase CarF family protein [Candidatus Binatia bacterium]